MADVRPFQCIRPSAEHAAEAAALPYDVYSRAEAKREVQGKPWSFLNIDRPETQFPDDQDMYAPEVYQKGREMLDREIRDGIYVTDTSEAYYVYEQSVVSGVLAPLLKGHVQTGIAACSSVDDYLNSVIKKHENTREEKEQDRIRHVDVLSAQTGPIFLSYRADAALKAITDRVKEGEALYDFTSGDGIRHRVFEVSDPETVGRIREAFSKIPATYIADGHHRAASAVKVGLKRRNEHPDGPKDAPYNFFLSVLFPDDELAILPYNRYVKDLNGLTKEAFLAAVGERFEIVKADGAVSPEKKGGIGMYLDGQWYRLTVREDTRPADPVRGLDVSVLQDTLLAPVLGIGDPRTDDRISFIGGIRGTAELEKLVNEGGGTAFSMHATEMSELLSVADAGLLMPPKSTWFEPKLRSGIFIHRI